MSWELDVAAWKRALVAATEAAESPAGLMVVVELAKNLEPYLREPRE